MRRCTRPSARFVSSRSWPKSCLTTSQDQRYARDSWCSCDTRTPASVREGREIWTLGGGGGGALAISVDEAAMCVCVCVHVFLCSADGPSNSDAGWGLHLQESL